MERLHTKKLFLLMMAFVMVIALSNPLGAFAMETAKSNVDDLSKEEVEVPVLGEQAIVALAQVDGALAAEQLNEVVDDTCYDATLKDILISYDEEPAPEQQVAFQAVIDDRADVLLEGRERVLEEYANADTLPYVPGEVIITFYDTATNEDEEQFVATEDVLALEPVQVSDEQIAVAKLAPWQDVQTAVAEYEESSMVKAVQPNYVYRLQPLQVDPETVASYRATRTATPNDPGYADQWAMGKINLQAAWSIVDTISNPKILVSVIDTGVKQNHPDLAGNLNTSLSTSFGGAYVAQDHGTLNCGIIGGRTNNGEYFSGIATGIDNRAVQLMSVDVFSGTDSASTANIIEAINYSVSKNAKVINMSLGGAGAIDLAFETAVNNAVNKGVTVVCSAGNDDSTVPIYPADFSSVISVIALDYTNNRASYSSYGNGDFISAPGGGSFSGSTNITEWIWNISATANSDGEYYTGMMGTSQAAPAVTGVVALMLYVNPSLTPSEIKEILKETAHDLGAPGYDIQTGYGLVNAGSAVQKADQNVPVMSVHLNTTATKVNVKSTIPLKTTISPSDATNKGVTWTSSNAAVATVSATGVVKGVKKGTATITVKTNNGAKIATCLITVQQPVKSLSFAETQHTLSGVGATKALSVAVYPEDADNQGIVWTSSDPSLVSVDSNGVVRAEAAGGNVIVSATAADGEGAIATVPVSVAEETVLAAKAPSTGDTTAVSAYLMFMLASGVILGIGVWRRKKSW